MNLSFDSSCSASAMFVNKPVITSFTFIVSFFRSSCA